MSSNSAPLKIIGFSTSSAYADRVDAIAKRERRTKRAVFESMVELYEKSAREQERTVRLVNDAIAAGVRDRKEGTLSREQWAEEWKNLIRYGAGKAKESGLSLEDVDALLYESRRKT